MQAHSTVSTETQAGKWHSVRNCGIAAAVLGMAMISRRCFAPGLRHMLHHGFRPRGLIRPVETPGASAKSTLPADPLAAALHDAKLEQTIAALEGFCYTIAHDLRAPLRSMEGFAQALLDDYRDRLDAEGIDYAERICAAARRMDRMIQDLLEFEKLATLEPTATRVETGPVVEKVLAWMADHLRRKGAKVTLKKPLLAVRANPALLEKVLHELISNAVQFVRPGARPQVRIWTEYRDRMVTLAVEDKGIGIAPEYQAQIFDPFVRLERRDCHTGTGIGLAIVKRSIERMAGKIELKSTPGGGTRFCVCLPAE